MRTALARVDGLTAVQGVLSTIHVVADSSGLSHPGVLADCSPCPFCGTPPSTRFTLSHGTTGSSGEGIQHCGIFSICTLQLGEPQHCFGHKIWTSYTRRQTESLPGLFVWFFCIKQLHVPVGLVVQNVWKCLCRC